LKVVIGAGGYNNNPGWIHTEENQLDIVNKSSWSRLFEPETIDAVLAEHVFEHMTYNEGVNAAKLVWLFLKPGGYLRCAVPDGYFKSESYQNMVKVGGPGPRNHPAASHKIVYNVESLTGLFLKAGFTCDLLEYHDRDGFFHYNDWEKKDGIIYRSIKVDPRNSETITFPSVIIDAVKPLK